MQERKYFSAREKHGCDARGHRARVAVQVYSRARVADPPADALQEVLHQNLFPPDQGKSQILAHFSRPGPEKAKAGEEVHTSVLKKQKGLLDLIDDRAQHGAAETSKRHLACPLQSTGEL